jgi:hypothetical protein
MIRTDDTEFYPRKNTGDPIMITVQCRIIVLAATLFMLSGLGHTADNETSDVSPHPLAVHMKHWIEGSGQWRSPNPSYDELAEPRTLGWVKEFGVNWKWGPNKQHLVGDIVAISADGEIISSSVMYAFYNPVTEKVINVQVARNGDFSIADDQVREQPTPYGDPEVSDGIHFSPNGSMNILRHSNVFVDPNIQLSDVYERNDEGKWEQTRQWRWVRVPID